MDKMQHLKI